MTTPRIFISHKNNDEDGDTVLPVLSQALTKAGFDVLVDRQRLVPGQEWRNEIYTWMGLCHGAVILLSPSARDDSIWVPRETSILLWRRTLNPKFVVIPLYTNGLSEADFNVGNFRDLNLGELQAVGGTPASAATEIMARFEKLQAVTPTPLEELAEQIASLLQGISDVIINRAADRLNIDLGAWNPDADPRKALALRMLQVSLRRSVDALEILVPHLESLETGERILGLIEPSWVDLCAARWVAECATRPGRKPSLVLNANRFRTAQLYVQRASSRPTKLSWPIVAATGVYGDKPSIEAVAEIEKALARQFRLEADPFAVDQAAEEGTRLAKLLTNRDQEGKPVFVALQPGAATADTLLELQRLLPLVTFFVLTGDQLPDSGYFDPADVHMVRPELTLGGETVAQGDIDFARSCIRW